jgi:4-hydroxy-tetrahydrodipicolinate synthase
LNDKLLPLANACFVEVNPIPVKEAMNLLGFDAGVPRAPLTEMEPQNREKLITAMQNFGLEVKA